MAIQPYLFFDGRADEAIAFYQQALGAKVEMLMRFKDGPDPSMIPPGGADKVMHSCLRIGDATVLMSDGRCLGKASFQGFGLSLTVPNEAEADRLVATLAGLETVYNPNKHVLRGRESDRPGAGEVWIDEIGAERANSGAGFVRVAGRTLPGVRSLERFTAWRLSTEAGLPAGPAVVTAATETLLCNAAFQKALHA